MSIFANFFFAMLIKQNNNKKNNDVFWICFNTTILTEPGSAYFWPVKKRLMICNGDCLLGRLVYIVNYNNCDHSNAILCAAVDAANRSLLIHIY